jgi:CRP/FNR family transcriptional regulator, cyclic AMP receptor protein
MMTPNEPRYGFWGQLVPSERTALRAAGSWSTYAPDSSILVEQDTTDHVVIIWSGLAKVCSRTANRREVILALRGSGDIVGEMAGIRGGPRTATVIALDEVKALLVKGERFTRFLGQHSHASAVLHQVLVGRLRDSDQYRIGAGTMNVGQRLARLLLQIEHRFGVPAENGTKISLALSQKDLAAFVGASERAVAREMERWRQREIVVTGRRWVIVQQSAALRRIAGPNGPPP